MLSRPYVQQDIKTTWKILVHHGAWVTRCRDVCCSPAYVPEESISSAISVIATTGILSEKPDTCWHVSIYPHSVRKPLQKSYDGLFPVISRHNETSWVYRISLIDKVCIDHIKVACGSRLCITLGRFSDDVSVSGQGLHLSLPATTSTDTNVSHSEQQTGDAAKAPREDILPIWSQWLRDPGAHTRGTNFLNLYSIEQRRFRIDGIEMVKMCRSLTGV